jgi:hypothetical protein
MKAIEKIKYELKYLYVLVYISFGDYHCHNIQQVKQREDSFTTKLNTLDTYRESLASKFPPPKITDEKKITQSLKECQEPLHFEWNGGEVKVTKVLHQDDEVRIYLSFPYEYEEEMFDKWKLIYQI